MCDRDFGVDTNRDMMVPWRISLGFVGFQQQELAGHHEWLVTVAIDLL